MSPGMQESLEARDTPQLMASQGVRSHSHIHRELNSANNSNEQGNRSSPRASGKERSPTDTSISVQGDLCQTSDVQNWR